MKLISADVRSPYCLCCVVALYSVDYSNVGCVVLSPEIRVWCVVYLPNGLCRNKTKKQTMPSQYSARLDSLCSVPHK